MRRANVGVPRSAPLTAAAIASTSAPRSVPSEFSNADALLLALYLDAGDSFEFVRNTCSALRNPTTSSVDSVCKFLLHPGTLLQAAAGPYCSRCDIASALLKKPP